MPVPTECENDLSIGQNDIAQRCHLEAYANKINIGELLFGEEKVGVLYPYDRSREHEQDWVICCVYTEWSFHSRRRTVGVRPSSSW